MALTLPPGLTLYFCRHGETEANVEKRFQGLTRDTSLTPRGRAQGAAIADRLRAHCPDPAALAFVASPLPRACRTMEIVRAALALPQGGYGVDPRIQEIDLGAWDGLTQDEARALDPAFYEMRDGDKWNIAPPGGETYADVAGRAQSWIADLARDTFAVSHGAFTRILRGLFAGLDAVRMSALDEPQGVVFRVRGSAVERFDQP